MCGVAGDIGGLTRRHRRGSGTAAGFLTDGRRAMYVPLYAMTESLMSADVKSGEQLRWHGLLALRGPANSWIGTGEESTWVVGRDGEWIAPFGPNVALLPLLEIRYQDIVGLLTPRWVLSKMPWMLARWDTPRSGLLRRAGTGIVQQAPRRAAYRPPRLAPC